LQAEAVIRALVAEALGCFFLFATVVGSGIMAETLAGGNVALALVGNTLAVAAILFVLVTMLAPISGAHFNPAVTLAFALRGETGAGLALAYVAAQLAGGILGVWAAHLMFDLPVLQWSNTVRTGSGQWLGEGIATFGLVLTVLATLEARREWVPVSVALYIAAAIWFTSSTCFANPAITAARSLTDTFTGIAPGDVPGFVAAQIAGTMAALATARLLLPGNRRADATLA
jgi:glycerol uptake facilitator-like aquaporin